MAMFQAVNPTAILATREQFMMAYPNVDLHRNHTYICMFPKIGDRKVMDDLLSRVVNIKNDKLTCMFCEHVQRVFDVFGLASRSLAL